MGGGDAMPYALGIESSCDETAAAVVRSDGYVLCSCIASQVAEHAPHGGIVPEIASRAHVRAIEPVVDDALSKLPGGLNAIDQIVVTQGPGLVGALIVGFQYAKTLAWTRGLPCLGVNHLHAHILAPYLWDDTHAASAPSMPYIALLVSGGHTALYRLRAPDDIELLGQTRDDAVGEAYDKIAKALGLGYPGGPLIDRLAHQGEPRFELPLPVLARGDLGFSFSGLKTAALRQIKAHALDQESEGLADFCASLQQVLISALVRKSLEACASQSIPRLVIAGGVAANRGLRALATEACGQQGIDLHIPPQPYCTDNAAMIAYAGLVNPKPVAINDGVYARDPHRQRGKR